MKREYQKTSGGIEWNPGTKEPFVPAGWVDTPLHELESNLASSKKIYEHAIGAAAVQGREAQELQEKVSTIPNIKQSIADVGAKIAAVEPEIGKTEQLLRELPAILSTDNKIQCAHCLISGVVKNGVLVETAAQDPQEVQAINAKQKELKAILAKHRDTVQEFKTTLGILRRNLQQAEEAEKQITAIDLTASPTVTVEDARKQVEEVELQIKAHRVKETCDELAEALKVNDVIVSVLAPEVSGAMC